MSILKVSGVQKVYTTRFGGNKVEALKSVSFEVEQGEYVAIMGESGSGKTKAAELVLFNLVHVDVNYDLRLNGDALWKTILTYGLIYLLLLVNSFVRVRKAKPLELMQSNRAGERTPKRTWLYAAVGMLFLGTAYYLAVSIKTPLTAMNTFFLAVLLVIIATYLLFMAGSVVLCRILQKNKKYYYTSKHFVSVSSMAYRMRRNVQRS